jgi:hypothetical protein
MKRIFKCIRGILPCRLSVYIAATPPSRPAKRVGICTSLLRMVPSQAERRNAKRLLARTLANALNARTACMFSGKPKIQEIIRRPTESHFCVPPGDAAIVASQARVLDALERTQLRDFSFC